jgi:pyruvate kinase
MKRTKIICTIGPSTETTQKLRHLVKAGMNCARLNFSHGTYEHHSMLIRNIRKAGDKAKEPIAIIQDLQGPRIRLGDLPEDGIAVKRNSYIGFGRQKSKI